MNNDKSNSVTEPATMDAATRVFLERLSMVTEGERDEVLRRIEAAVANAKREEATMIA